MENEKLKAQREAVIKEIQRLRSEGYIVITGASNYSWSRLNDDERSNGVTGVFTNFSTREVSYKTAAGIQKTMVQRLANFSTSFGPVSMVVSENAVFNNETYHLMPHQGKKMKYKDDYFIDWKIVK